MVVASAAEAAHVAAAVATVVAAHQVVAVAAVVADDLKGKFE